MSETNDFGTTNNDKINSLIKRLSKIEKGNGGKKIESETEKLITILMDPRLRHHSHLIDTLEVAVDAVSMTPARGDIAANIRESVSNNLADHIPFRVHRLQELAPPIILILGLVGFVYVSVPILYVFWDEIQNTHISDVPLQVIVMVGFFGAVGSIISMMVRVNEFSEDAQNHSVDPLLTLINGFFRPIIGMSFALFVFFAIKSGFLPIKVDNTDSTTYFFWSIAFLVGFSERLAKNIVTLTESRLTPQSSSASGLKKKGKM